VIHELARLRDRTRVFRDRGEAGAVLTGMLARNIPPGARILAIPAGGVPVALPLARALGVPLDVAVVSKITPSWHSEAGYGAVAFDGRVRVDEARREQLGVAASEVGKDVDRTAARVRRRVERFRGGRGPVVAPGDAAVLVDDGLASGVTMATAAEAVRAAGAARIVVAVPTASEEAAKRLAEVAEEVYCANLRAGPRFAVADAYVEWFDLDDAAVLEILTRSADGNLP